MRENRTYGSEGGEAGEPAFPTPIVETAPSLHVISQGGFSYIPRNDR